jgi:DNA-binding MarR family transcriptional regulator
MTLEEALKTNRFRNARHKAALNIMYSAYWLKQMSNILLKDYGLTHEQFNVLRILKGKYPEQMCVRDIGERMIERSSNVPRIIDRLEIKKLVRRVVSPHDKRETLVVMQQPGLKLLDMISNSLDQVFDKQLDLTEAEATALHELLEKMKKGG